jgi:hypothetical protein
MRAPSVQGRCARRSLEKEEVHVEELCDGNLLMGPGR